MKEREAIQFIIEALENLKREASKLDLIDMEYGKGWLAGVQAATNLVREGLK